MSTTTFVRPLRGALSNASQKAASACRPGLPEPSQCKSLGLRDIAMDQIDLDPAEKNIGNSRFNLWKILFPDRSLETYRSLEGEDMTPFVAYKSGSRYYVNDESGRLAAARSMGKAFILAQVCEMPCSATARA